MLDLSVKGAKAQSRALAQTNINELIERKENETMAELKGTKTHQNLKDAFAGESMANRRYLYFAKVADVEGYPELAVQ